MYPLQAPPLQLELCFTPNRSNSDIHERKVEGDFAKDCRSRSTKNRKLTNSAAHLKFAFQRMKSQCRAIKWSNHGINELNGQNCKVNLSVNILIHINNSCELESSATDD